jgi:hypothetical protein
LIPTGNPGQKKTGPKAGFSFLDPELLGSRSGSSSVSRSSFCSSVSRGGFFCGSSSVSRGGFFCGSSSVSRGGFFNSRRFNSRCFSRRSSFFFLAASGHGDSQQSGQESGIFHLISLYLRI